jgi:PadR family transcriptional regulator PadR
VIADERVPGGVGPRGRGRRGVGPGYCGGQNLGPDDELSGFGGPGSGRYRRSVLETSILALLADSASHGYDLVEQVSGLAADLVCIDPGSMYRLLRGLESQGLVRSSWETADAGPSRRVYEITEQGIEALEFMAESLSLRAKSMQRLADQATVAAAKAKVAQPKK